MSTLRKLTSGAALVAAALVGTVANAQYSYTTGPVTFSIDVIDDTHLTLTMDGLDAAGSNWADADYLQAFSLKGLGTTSVSLGSYGGAYTTFANELANSGGTDAGCTGGDSGGVCFEFAGFGIDVDPGSNTLSFGLVATGGTSFDFGEGSPHLKILFTDYKANGQDGPGQYMTGGLLSQNLVTPPVPEPSTYALMLAGLGVVGFMARRRRPA